MIIVYTSDGTRFLFKGDRLMTCSTTRRSRWRSELLGWLASLQIQETDMMERR